MENEDFIAQIKQLTRLATLVEGIQEKLIGIEKKLEIFSCHRLEDSRDYSSTLVTEFDKLEKRMDNSSEKLEKKIAEASEKLDARVRKLETHKEVLTGQLIALSAAAAFIMSVVKYILESFIVK